MAFPHTSAHRSFRAPRDAFVFAVGRRVYINCSGSFAGSIALTDEAGASEVANVTDGTEVDILAWRPRGSSGTRYRVRSTGNDLEGWIAAGNQRGAQSVVPPAEVEATAARESVDPRPRFGRRAR
jgi:hypothetical protein